MLKTSEPREAVPSAFDQPYPFELRPLSPTLGAEVIGVDLAQPLSDPDFDRIYEAFLEHQLLLFRDQHLAPGDQVVFARRFGPVQVHVMNQYHAEGFPEIYYLSNLDASGPTDRQAPGQGHGALAHRWLLGAAHRPGDPALCRPGAPFGRRDPVRQHVRRLRRSRPGHAGSAWRRYGQSTPWIFRARAAMATTR